jgi:hypothetical protein
MKRKRINLRRKATRKTPDILNDILADGGRIDFHTGRRSRKFVGTNKVIEEGFWDAMDGGGSPCKIPYKFVAVMGEPIFPGSSKPKKPNN